MKKEEPYDGQLSRTVLRGGGVAYHGYLLLAAKSDTKMTPYPTSFCCAKSIIG